MRRFGVRGDPEEEAIRLYNRVRRGGRWPESYWERPGRIRAAWAILDYWLRRIRGSEDPTAFRKLSEAEVVKQGLERPVGVMEDLYGQHWRDLAREARAALRIARKLNAGGLGEPADWKVIPGRYERLDAMFIRWDELQWVDEHSERLHEAVIADETLEQFEIAALELRTEERARPDYLSPDNAWKWEVEQGGATVVIHERLLSMVLDKWVERGGVRPSVFLRDERRSIRLGGYGLLGALAVQLVFDVCGTDGLAVCSSCGTPYLPPKRRPRQDRNSYCPDCGLKAAVRDAAARYRQTDKYRDARARRRARGRRAEQESDGNPEKFDLRE